MMREAGRPKTDKSSYFTVASNLFGRVTQALRWFRARRLKKNTRSKTAKYGGRHRSTHFAARRCEARVPYAEDEEPHQ